MENLLYDDIRNIHIMYIKNIRQFKRNLRVKNKIQVIYVFDVLD